MRGILSKLFGGAAPLSGAPPVRRVKTHSAESGYVYQYYFEGFRESRGYEYVFQAAADRRTWKTVSVILARDVIEDWVAVHQRGLSASERFGISKIALRDAFDQAAEPASLPVQVRVGRADLARIAQFLDIP